MAGYSRKELQILGGGFNLLPPGDKTPITDYLLAQNWRSDRVGKLQSRYGYPQKFSIAGAGLAHSAGIHGGLLGDYYIAANSGIVAPTSNLYFNFNPTPIATGFDGNRVGFACMNGFCYVMNRGNQGRHQAGSAFQPWTLSPPSNSATAAGAATPGAAASATYNYTPQSPTYVHFLTIAGVNYSFVENGYSAAQLPLVIASLASMDPNCSVTFPGTGSAVTITPIVPNTLFALTGSDANAPANVATGAVSSLPNGTYQYYVTFAASDDSLESNGGPASAAVTVVAQSVTLTNVPVSADPRVGKRNIYAVGGTLGQAYLVGTIGDNSTTTITISIADLDATNSGVTMPTDNDLPPAASGVGGPHFSRLFAWSTVANVNRLFYTEPNLPQYWPGANDPAIGNWVDVGMEGEAIVWCTFHTNIVVIYKERSIWMLIGDPSSGTLVRVRDGLGLTGAFAVCDAGTVDYFVAPGGLCVFDMDRATEMGSQISPLFNSSLGNSGTDTPPGSVLLGSAYNSTSIGPYAVALGYAMGKLYVGYAEAGGALSYCLLVYHEASQRWFYHRNSIAGATGWFGFLFDGYQIVGLTGSTGGAAQGYNLDDFRGFFSQDSGGAPIECTYQSHYEDCGLPDNQKVWLELVIDYEFSGETALVGVFWDNGAAGLSVLTHITGGQRTQTSIPLASALGTATLRVAGTIQDDLLAKNISVLIDCIANHQLIIHNVYLYYYEEARLAAAASTLPTDLGSAKVKQCKELQLDINPSGGAVDVQLYSDLPGNVLAVQQTPTVAIAAGRAVWKYPFPVTEGFLWRIALAATALPFRLYGARLLMRVVGVYVEAYEAAAGFVWDSMELTFDSGITHIPRSNQIALAALLIKRFREISFEIETFNGAVTVSFLTDLPGNKQAVRFSAVINTGTAGRRFVRLPLPAGVNPEIEGRLCRLQLSGAAKFILYQAAVETLAIGVYIEAYEAAGGAVYDSRELDFTTPVVKEARELELDLEISGAVSWQLLSDLTGLAGAVAATAGRQKVMIPLTINAPLDQFVEGRLLRLLLTSTNAIRLYGARILIRAFGQYLTADETSHGALWDTTELDLGSQTVKQLRELELDIWAYGAFTVTIYTDLPGNTMLARVTSPQAATVGRTTLQIPLPQGLVPDNYIFGRLVRVTVTSASAFKLFGARIDARAIGVYVENYEAAGGAVWDSTPSDLGSPSDKTFDELHIEMDSDGAALVAVYTDLPGETFTSKGTYPLTNGVTSRHWATVPLPAGVEGRSVRLVVSSGSGFRIYKAQVRAAQVGRYLCAQTPAGQDAFNTLEFDFRSERVKVYKKFEVDMRADGPVSLSVITNQSEGLAVFFSPVLATPNGRETLSVVLPPGARGRLLRLQMTSPAAARIYHLRVWTRPLNDEKAAWEWQDYPLEESEVLPSWKDLPVAETAPAFTWADLPVTPTKPEWQWAPFPVNPTEAQWFWAKVLSVEDTPDLWEWIDVPFQVSG